jgi:hypothetical protein
MDPEVGHASRRPLTIAEPRGILLENWICHGFSGRQVHGTQINVVSISSTLSWSNVPPNLGCPRQSPAALWLRTQLIYGLCDEYWCIIGYGYLTIILRPAIPSAESFNFFYCLFRDTGHTAGISADFFTCYFPLPLPLRRFHD